MSEHNIYETFREAIKATVYNTVCKVRDTSVSFSWQLGKVISACAEVCKLPLKDTPDDFKRIVKFEFQKLKESVIDNGYELDRSKEDFILKDGDMKARLTNIYSRFVAIETQIIEARKAFDRIHVKIADESLSMEKRSTLRKKANRYLIIIDHKTAELERQKVLQAEVEKTIKKEEVKV